MPLRQGDQQPLIRHVIRTVSALILALLLSVSAFAQDEVIGRLDAAPKPLENEHPFYAQSELGSVCADAFRVCANADIALVNVGDLGDDLVQGEVTAQDIRDILPYDRELAVAQVTPRQLFELLEHAVSKVVLDMETEYVDEETSRFDGFCQISGIALRYDVSAPAGQRILEVKLPDETLLSPEDDTTLLTLCASGFMLEGGYGFPETEAELLGITQTEAMADHVSEHRALPTEDLERIVFVGARQTAFLGVISREIIFVAALLLCVLLALNGTKLKRYRDEYGNVPGSK